MCKETKRIYSDLNKSPMFKLSLSSKELFHSNFLEWLSNVDRDAFVKLINIMAGSDHPIEWPDNWRVKREFHNFDLCVVAYDESDYRSYDEKGIEDEDNLRILFVVENKVKSIPYKEQLKRYEKEAKELNDKYWKCIFQKRLNNTTFDCYRYENDKWYGCTKTSNGRGRKADWGEKPLDSNLFKDLDTSKLDAGTKYSLSLLKDNYINNKSKSPIFILLSLATDFPNKERIIDSWRICPYDEYQGFIKECYLNITENLFRSLIEDYCGFVESLSSLSKEWENDYKNYEIDDSLFLYDDNSNYKDAKAYRIHDLYQKLKFSFLCTRLYDKINESYGTKYTVFPSNLGGLFKEVKNDTDGKKKDKDFICVNYTYLHGDPLLEINVHPECCGNNIEFYYTIQVQGNAYERGIQVKRIPKVEYQTTSKGKDDIAVYVWKKLLPNAQIILIKNWMTLTKTGLSDEWKEDGILLKEFENNRSTKDEGYNAYNMSDGTYLYQKKRIINDASINQVINKMIADLGYVIQNLK